ncbi:DUF6484 domain-containing protein [Vitiosangium sp. GDMCC 1.1324]|uniref:DUF6484 domain-containing protein n=1 Tax=Vitiosangium sp. (strain GDMCC 1.1324) TaxID=2138576 RepID=UPI000D399597|nr:DUF6484 domain-containing protein [Vitiosangium sp. GDMCC 1.1324]PTL77835.1 hypothetical protein DAT35_42295 [Vitiosangium sp. GDMCC 1.1324]
MTSPTNPSAASNPEPGEQEPISGTRLGWLIGSDAEGHFLVDYDGNRAGPLTARRTITLKPEELRDAIATRRRAVLLFENGDPRLPLVVGMEQVQSPTPLTDAVLEASLPTPAPQQPMEAHVDGKQVVIEGKDEIVLQCGQASITLRRNGKVIIKGTYIETHSEGVNRIKGGSVHFN